MSTIKVSTTQDERTDRQKNTTIYMYPYVIQTDDENYFRTIWMQANNILKEQIKLCPNVLRTLRGDNHRSVGLLLHLWLWTEDNVIQTGVQLRNIVVIVIILSLKEIDTCKPNQKPRSDKHAS